MLEHAKLLPEAQLAPDVIGMSLQASGCSPVSEFHLRFRPVNPEQLPRATMPADAVCKEALKRFKKSRSVDAMRAAAEAYYEEALAHKFP